MVFVLYLCTPFLPNMENESMGVKTGQEGSVNKSL